MMNTGWLWRALLDKINSFSKATSMNDVFLNSSFIKIVKHYDKWIVTNISKKNINLLVNVGLNPSIT
jgi:hypothetical protein